MINLFDSYTQSSWDLHFSLIKSGYINPTIALNDDGFLPDDVTSPYLYYTGFAKTGAGRPLYYNELRVPDTWEIIGFSSGADIVDLGVKKGRIIYANPNHKRLIKEVDWFDEQGRVILKDRFNKFGFCFAQTFYNADGQAIQTSYYNKDRQEVISENHMTGDYILNDNNQFKVFKSKVEFVINYLQEAKFNLDRIFYNSLSTPFLVSFYLNRLESKDVLFWQEPLVDDIPGNMRLLLNNPSPNTKIVIQSYEAYANAMRLLTDEEQKQVSFLGFMYPLKETEKLHNQALILTNSDQIEALESLVTSLPNLTFNIGALTEMTSDLMNFGKYDNVVLYPNITTNQIQYLSNICAFYLDINHHNEILSAVRSAFEHQQLIFAFEETSHQIRFVSPKNIFPKKDIFTFISHLQPLIGNKCNIEKALKQQLEDCHVSSSTQYQSVIN